MKLYNNTTNKVFYSISAPGLADCGTIEAGDTSPDLTSYDNQAAVNVGFTASPNSDPPTPFTVNIPNPKPGMTVTIGIFQE